MATTTMVHVRLDGKLKARAEKALAAMGLSVSDAVRVLLTRIAAEKALPFEVKVPNARTRAAMKELESGKLRRCATVSDLIADLKRGRCGRLGAQLPSGVTTSAKEQADTGASSTRF